MAEIFSVKSYTIEMADTLRNSDRRFLLSSFPKHLTLRSNTETMYTCIYIYNHLLLYSIGIYFGACSNSRSIFSMDSSPNVRLEFGIFQQPYNEILYRGSSNGFAVLFDKTKGMN